MTPLPRAESTTRALIERPPLAVLDQGDGAEPAPSPVPAPAEPSAREERIRAAAYARYEARGREPGHEVEDWLAAEAALSASSSAAGSPPAAAAR